MIAQKKDCIDPPTIFDTYQVHIMYKYVCYEATIYCVQICVLIVNKHNLGQVVKVCMGEPDIRRHV